MHAALYVLSHIGSEGTVQNLGIHVLVRMPLLPLLEA